MVSVPIIKDLQMIAELSIVKSFLDFVKNILKYHIKVKAKLIIKERYALREVVAMSNNLSNLCYHLNTNNKSNGR